MADYYICVAFNPNEKRRNSCVDWRPAPVTAQGRAVAENPDLRSAAIELDNRQGRSLVALRWSATFYISANVRVTDTKVSNSTSAVGNDRGES